MPPRFYVQLPVQEAYNPQVADPLFHTLVQVRGLAYRTGGDHTPPLTLDELVALRGGSRRSMCRHLQALRTAGYLRIEPSGENAFVIHLLHWEPGAGLPPRPARGQGMLTPMERTALFGDAGHHPPKGPPDGGSLRESASAASVKLVDNFGHVVVESSDPLPETLELHDHDSAFVKNDGEHDKLAQELANIMIAHGLEPDAAQKKARRLLAEFGGEVCARQERVFERRCELARESPGGLRNPIGMLHSSIRGDWSLPTEKDEKAARRWYTDEEFEMFFEH